VSATARSMSAPSQSLDATPPTSEPFVVEFVGSGPALVVLTATSFANPVDEDPDPSNNVVEIMLG